MHKADFERLLASRSRGRSAHFAVYYVNGSPAPTALGRARSRKAELSTDSAQVVPQVVENPPSAHWLGCLVPKRQAKRATTRNLVKRHMRDSFRRHAAVLPQGLWLLRLHAGFPVCDFPSGCSEVLAMVVRDELDRLLTQAARR